MKAMYICSADKEGKKFHNNEALQTIEKWLKRAHCKLQVGTSGWTWMTVDEDICSATCISDAFIVMQILCDAINKTLDMASYFSFSFQLSCNVQYALQKGTKLEKNLDLIGIDDI